MISEKEKRLQDFFNKRIKVQGDENFVPEIGEKNDSGWMILNFLKSHIRNKGKILDAGCGEGRFARYFIEKGFNLIGMDFSEEYVRLAKKKIGKGKFVVGSVTNIPFKDNSFDYIFTVDVLQHVPDLRQALSELYRVLKKEGVLIVVDKNKFGLHRRYLVPHRLIQKYRELTQWRYKGFKERWFNPEKFTKTLLTQFKEVKQVYLIEKNKSRLFYLFPKLNFFSAWVAKK